MLIAPTLKTILPEIEAKILKTVIEKLTAQGDIMASFSWLATVYNQMANSLLDRLYKGHLMTLPGLPLKAALECHIIPETKELIQRLIKTNIPTLVVRGKNDEMDAVSVPALRRALENKSNENIHVKRDLTGVLHQIHIENPKIIFEFIKELVARIEKSPIKDKAK